MDNEYIKRLTGTGSETAQFNNANERTFPRTWLLYFLTNSVLFGIDYNDTAVLERLEVIKFINRFVKKPVKSNEYLQDGQLMKKMELEKPGILALIVRMYQLMKIDEKYAKETNRDPSLFITKEIEGAKEEYLRTAGLESILDEWLEDEAEHIKDEKVKTTLEDAWKSFEMWVNEPARRDSRGKRMKDEGVETKVKFGKAMERKENEDGLMFHYHKHDVMCF